MMGFDLHKRCAHCSDKGLVKTPVCKRVSNCDSCDIFTETLHAMLPTPQYQIHKDNKSGIFVSPKDVTVLSMVDTSVQEDAWILLCIHNLWPVSVRTMLIPRLVLILFPSRKLFKPVVRRKICQI